MKNSKKKSSVGLILRIVFCAIFAAYIVVIALRAQFFKGDSLIRNMYEEDFATDILARLLKTGFIFAICFLIFQASSGIAKLSDKIKNNSAKTTFLLLGNLLKYVAAIAFVLVPTNNTTPLFSTISFILA